MNKSVSILGSSYFSSISALVEKIQESTGTSKQGAGVGNNENGYAVSICLLSVVCLESYVMRVRHVHSVTGDQLNRHQVSKFLKDIYEDYPTFEETNEIFAIRDLIAHNHLIEESYIYDEDMSKKVLSSNRISSGDKKFKASVTNDLKKTKILGLNTNPTKIGYEDAMLVLQTVWKILLYLEGQDRYQCYVSHLNVKHKGKFIKMAELVGLPDTCT